MYFVFTSGENRVQVPPSTPLTYPDLQNLLGATAKLNISEPPKRKQPKAIEKIKPIKPGTSQHQPWLEINIKVRMSPGKNDPTKALGTSKSKMPSGGRKKKGTTKKKSVVKIPKRSYSRAHHQPDKRAAPVKKEENGCYWSNDGVAHRDHSQACSSESQTWLKAEAANGDQNQVTSTWSSVPSRGAEGNPIQSSIAGAMQSGNSLSKSSPTDLVSSSAGIYQDQTNLHDSQHLTSSSQSTWSSILNTPSTSSSGFAQSSFFTPDSEEMPNLHLSTPEGEVDLTCIDVLSPEDDGSPLAFSTPSANVFTKDLLFPSLADLDSSTPHIPSNHGDGNPLPWIRYGSSPPDNVPGSDSVLHTEHSYSARVLSPDILKTISASQLQTYPVFGDADLKECSKRDKKDEKVKPGKVYQTTACPPYEFESPPPDSILQAVVLMEPPADCVPPSTTNSEGDAETIKALGLDFEEDSDSSSLGSFSQSSTSPDMHTFDVENVDPVYTSFTTQQTNSSMRRSWINGYQLFTKINHQRIKR